ncbi:TetR/AcrR family transcriptional regulator [Pseudomonas sp. MBLB4136]|uniref:TetR/AcrR family transcriptional regulator n=1 Tax=Pseudomonas sp. MBLB4136 TaxID=3451558 RepID=UPI003F753D86
MASVPKTRERILQASMALFNAQGERTVTTNHIAAHLGISPGNLYYHFRNKQAIIAELFGQYEQQVDAFLRLPEGRALTLADKPLYLEALLAAMWQFRFLHRDLEHLLDCDVELAARYRAFAQRCLHSAQGIYQGFVDAGVLSMRPAQIEALALNAWIIMTSWVRFLSTAGDHVDDLSEEMLRRGIYQVLALEDGFIEPAARSAVEELQGKLFVPLVQVF